jgi:hypothetical protein
MKQRHSHLSHPSIRTDKPVENLTHPYEWVQLVERNVRVQSRILTTSVIENDGRHTVTGQKQQTQYTSENVPSIVALTVKSFISPGLTFSLADIHRE